MVPLLFQAQKEREYVEKDLGGLDDSSLRGLVKLIHCQVQVEKALVWLSRGNPKMDTADEIRLNNNKNSASDLGLKKYLFT